MRVLAIVHQSDAGPGVFADEVRAAGARLDQWLLPAGGSPPAHPSSYDAVFTFGGAMHADQEDRHPWLAQEKALLAELLEQGVPLLGVCLGAQLLAEAAGGSARPAAEPEIGWYEVTLDVRAGADPVIGPLPPRFQALQWHSYEFVPPSRATALASSAACTQAFGLDERAWGIQFHAEVTLQAYESWIEDHRTDPNAVRLSLEPDELRARTRTAIAAWNELGRGLCGRFLDVAATRRN